MTEADLRLLLFIKLIWGTFLAFMLAWGFHSSWRYEHGARSYTIYMGAPAGHKLTYVYFDPLTLPMVLGIYLLLILLIGPGNFDILTGFFLGAILTISIYFGLLLLLLPLLCMVADCVPVLLWAGRSGRLTPVCSWAAPAGLPDLPAVSPPPGAPCATG